MKYILPIVVAGFLLGILSCRCEGTFFSASYIENKSNQEASLLFYKGSLSQEKKLAIGDSIQLDERKGRTKGTGADLINVGLSNYDSIIVEFPDGRKLIHYYRVNKPGSNSNTFNYTDKRNVFNPANFKMYVLSEKRCYLETLYMYTLTNEDYAASR
ncbi:MAG: hypothetical protein LH609_07345 [Rudanella sp.]|nr:hypothetical protein [Rudanella sp.]